MQGGTESAVEASTGLEAEVEITALCVSCGTQGDRFDCSKVHRVINFLVG